VNVGVDKPARVYQHLEISDFENDIDKQNQKEVREHEGKN
jgi:hypothetical protein